MLNTEQRAWLRLVATPKVGPVAARKLLAGLGAPEAIFDASAAALAALVGDKLAQALRQPPEHWEALQHATNQWLDGGDDRHLMALGDSDYPSVLLETSDPPVLLHLMGQRPMLQHARKVAIVGSRNPTPQGLDNARAFAHALSDAGVCVVSGLALGIDGAAHQGALQGPTGSIAVVGTGLDRVYPKSHHALAHALTQQGVLISEYPIGTGPLPANFPKRNRLIAGLSQGTLVVEAALESGSLITAQLATDMGREVFAIPGSIHATQSKGCHALIRQGAKLVEAARDVLEDLQFQRPLPLEASPNTAAAALSAQATPDAVLNALGHDPTDLDTLQARTGLTTADLQARLWTLEMQGALRRLPGGLFQQTATA